MKTESIIFWVIYFIVTIVIAWIALGLILLWFKPVLFNDDGSLNWWAVLGVAALQIIFTMIIVLILMVIVNLFRAGSCCNSNGQLLPY